jgi:hypothetical protein
MYQFNGKKRVAGSAFVINCRTDRQFLHSNSFHANVGKECFDVKVGEAIMAMGKNVYNTNNAYGFTSMNGARTTETPKFIGVAETPSTFSEKTQDHGFVARVGGIITVFNGGNQPIFMGDPIKIELTSNKEVINNKYQYNPQQRDNQEEEKGIHPHKIRYVFAKSEEMSEFVTKKMVNAFNSNTQPQDANQLYTELGSIFDEWRTMVVGTAKSSCSAGQRFEMLLHRRHY